MASENNHIAHGDGLLPHDSNPNSAKADVEEAMRKATEAAEKEPAEPKEPENADKLAAEPGPADEGTPASEPDGDAPKAALSEPAPEVGDLQPPADWSADDQDVFRNVDKDVQEWLLQRDTASRELVQSQVSALQPYQQFQQQWDPYFQQLGQPAPQLLNGLMQTEMTLRTGTEAQKRAMLGQIMRDYGISLEQQPAQPALPEELAGDPLAQSVTQQLTEFRQGLEAMQAQMTSQFGNLQQSQAQAQDAELQRFKSATDDKGNLQHPYFDQVRPLMEALATSAITQGQTPTLEEVYNQACRASPDVYAKLQSAERAAGLVERQKAAAAKTAASKSVTSSPSGSRTSVALDGGKPNESVRETVERAFAASAGSA